MFLDRKEYPTSSMILFASCIQQYYSKYYLMHRLLIYRKRIQRLKILSKNYSFK